ncbi:Cobyrinic acid A,C-diamide synthase [Aquisphaera giovannonii]|uniref:Cobyrinic acid A,C-diamide synthase n=1 Tax=Aquisphaera giovannonii TaxID=406548 RepID=A0A5B9W855_9BACT|nr:cobyrinic acid a,c-diamide synthase [Aquisphaera giovannonii]QEH36100.1 Cobyrinic acid A,C-diamide synthase [Aquisphaera giovannonii]
MMSLALMAGLAGSHRRVQHFRTRACPTATELVGQVTGLPGRHLDSWLMPEPVCRALFAGGSRGAQMSIVEGTLDPALAGPACGSSDLPGSLEEVARMLDLPTVAVVAAPDRQAGVLHIPRLPDGIDGVLIDRLADPEDLPRLRRMIRLATGVPVLGALEVLPSVRRLLEGPYRPDYLPESAVEALARNFLRHSSLEAIRDVADGRGPLEAADLLCACGLADCCRCFRVAYAQDEAFGRYFPDTFEALEALGAELVEFSPLRDEALPEGVDLVMIGCGIPDEHAERLSSNLSMMAALRQHVCRGHRIYTEGGGTAYLGRWLVVGGRPYRGAAIFPFTAERTAETTAPTPVSRMLTRDCWLGTAGTTFRGYRSGRWRLTPSHEPLECPGSLGTLCEDGDIYYHHHAVGGLIHLHLGSLPQVVAAFANPHRPSLRRPSVRG